MPLLVTDYTWTQTETNVYVNVPLKGTKVKNVDIVSTEEYLKVHFPPYLFEAFLFELVDNEQSSAKVGNGVVIFNLPKRTKKLWDHLMISSNDKETKKEIRERALEKYQQKLCSDSKQKAEKRMAENKYALETMMELEREERAKIQQIKDAEREKTSAELAAWKQKQQEEAEAAKDLHQRNSPKQHREDEVKAKKEPAAVRKVQSGTKSKKKPAELPPPRVSGNIQITFTPRAFPTALRESKIAEEEEWLKKQAEARRAFNADMMEVEDLTEEERNPDWLKEKGNKCFVKGDHLGAVNAYNLAIRLNSNIPALYSNRAACHLKLRNLHKAIEDASKALDLLTPPVAANAAARARASVRRGSAFCELQLYVEGLMDYDAALKIYPDDETLQADAQKIRNIIEDSVVDPSSQRNT